MILSGYSSPYPLSYSIRWLYYFLNPSTSNYTNISPKPLIHSFKNLPDTNYIKVMVCGDIMVRHDDKILKFDKNLKKLLGSADIIVTNCEAPISNNIVAKKKRKHKFYFFLMPANYLLETLNQIENKWIISIANNHIADNGYEGYKKTIEILQTQDSHGRNDISVIGHKNYNSKLPLSIFNIETVRFGIVSWTQWMNKDSKIMQSNGVYRTSDIFDPSGRVIHNWSAIKKEKDIDTLLAYPHWGFEFQHFPSQNCVDQAKKLLESGIDMIAGSHAHVLQAMDLYNDKICIYNLGNLCGLGGSLWPTKLTAIFEARISTSSRNNGEIIGYTIHPVVQMDNKNKLVLLKDFNSKLKLKTNKRLNIMYY